MACIPDTPLQVLRFTFPAHRIYTHNLCSPDQGMPVKMGAEAMKTITPCALFCSNYVMFLTERRPTVTPLFATQVEVLSIIIMIGMLPMMCSLAVGFLTDHRNTEHGIYSQQLVNLLRLVPAVIRLRRYYTYRFFFNILMTQDGWFESIASQCYRDRRE